MALPNIGSVVYLHAVNTVGELIHTTAVVAHSAASVDGRKESQATCDVAVPDGAGGLVTIPVTLPWREGYPELYTFSAEVMGGSRVAAAEDVPVLPENPTDHFVLTDRIRLTDRDGMWAEHAPDSRDGDSVLSYLLQRVLELQTELARLRSDWGL